MIKGIVISVLTKCIYYKALNGTDSQDPDFIGSFLSAINSYANEVNQDNIRSIVMGKTVLYYRILDESSNLLLVLIADREGDENLIKQILYEIEEAFKSSYRPKAVIAHASEPHYFATFDSALNIIMYKNFGKILF